MKKLVAIGIVLGVITLPFAFAEKTVDRPPGVAADQWYPISDRLGLVIPDYQPARSPLVDNGPIRVYPPPVDGISPHPAPRTVPDPPTGLPRTPPVVSALFGYLMIKQQGHWIRLSVAQPPILPFGTEDGTSQN
jgi:hypothetical protein